MQKNSKESCRSRRFGIAVAVSAAFAFCAPVIAQAHEGHNEHQHDQQHQNMHPEGKIPVFNFDIPALPLAEALKTFATQGPPHMRLVYDEALIVGKSGQAVQGQFNPRIALMRLLADSGVVIASARQGVVTLSRAENAVEPEKAVQ